MPDVKMIEQREDEGFRPSGTPRRAPYTREDLGKFQAVVENQDLHTEDGTILHRKMESWRHEAAVREAMTIDTFPLMFADVIDRKLRAGFTGVGTPLAPLFGPVRHVRAPYSDIKSNATEGLATRLQEVKEKGEYNAREQGESEATYEVKKYGAQADFSMEAWLRDDLDAFARFPGEMARAAVNTEAWLQTTQFANAAGLLAATFVGTGGQAAVSALTLTEANVETALQAMGLYTSNGEPIENMAVFLIVNPSLRLTAKRITKSDRYNYGADDETRVGDMNTIRDEGLIPIVDKWLPLVNTTSPTTCWFLAARPTDIQGAEFAKINGKDEPELWQKASNAVKVGGGTVSPFEGDFETDNIFYRVRHMIGAVAVEPRAFWGSNGA